jgi:lysyl-tRNA synthetase class 2
MNIRIVPSHVYDGGICGHGIPRQFRIVLLYLAPMDPALRERLGRHARFATEIRAFFTRRGYIEVETPILSPFLIPEPSIEVFATRYMPGRGDPRPLWLAPSPELWMKRLLGRGSGDIFQISRCFRNADFGSPLHNPEFRLLEWYTVGRRSTDAIEVTEDLFEHLLGSVGCRGDRARLAPPFSRMSMADAFRTHAGIELASCDDAGSMRAAAWGAGVQAGEDATWEQAFHLVFLDRVEPQLPRGRPLVLTDYPAQVPTTARRRQGTPWADRWELYVGGIELANCYTEETRRNELSRLLEEEERRKAAALVPHAPDRELAGAFPPGFPDCTGTALGVDRLEMVFDGETSLEGVILFPFSAIIRPQSGQG